MRKSGKLSGGRYSVSTLGGSVAIGYSTASCSCSIWMTDLVEAVVFLRTLEEALNEVQPGLYFPLPEGDPNELKALNIIRKADELEGSFEVCR